MQGLAGGVRHRQGRQAALSVLWVREETAVTDVGLSVPSKSAHDQRCDGACGPCGGAGDVSGYRCLSCGGTGDCQGCAGSGKECICALHDGICPVHEEADRR